MKMSNIFTYKTASDKEFAFPTDCYYISGEAGHIWAKEVQPGIYRIGFDALGASVSGAIRHLRVRKGGKIIEQMKPVGTVESGKWIGPIMIPFTGTIKTVNTELAEKPGLINEDCYGKGWVVEIEVDKTKIEAEKKHALLIPPNDVEKLKTYIEKEAKRFNL